MDDQIALSQQIEELAKERGLACHDLNDYLATGMTTDASRTRGIIRAIDRQIRRLL